jgi:hypothetical protein
MAERMAMQMTKTSVQMKSVTISRCEARTTAAAVAASTSEQKAPARVRMRRIRLPLAAHNAAASTAKVTLQKTEKRSMIRLPPNATRPTPPGARRIAKRRTSEATAEAASPMQAIQV